MTPLAWMVLTAVGTLALLVIINWLRRQRAGTSGERAWQTRADDFTPLDEVASWFRDDRESAGWTGSIEETTWTDLDGDRLFRAMDYTDTPLGRQVLYATLRAPEDAAQREVIHALANACSSDETLRRGIRAALRVHRGSGGYRMHRLLRDRDLVPRWGSTAPAISVLIVIGVLLVPVVPRALIWLAPLTLLGLTVRLVGMGRVAAYVGPLRELAPVLWAATRLLSLTDTLPLEPAQRLSLRNALAPEGVPLSRLSRMVRVVHPQFIVGDAFIASLYEYVNLLLLLDLNALIFTDRIFRRHGKELERLCTAVGLFDAACSVAAFRSTRTWCVPEFVEETRPVRLTAVQHPSLSDGVTNDVTLARGRGLLLTGANMSGKSTLLRAIGVNVLLGRSIATCTARAAELPVTQVFTSIGHSDDLERGVSYFYAEARAVATLLTHAAERRALFLFDELFRGTNAAERVAAAEAVLRQVVRGGGGAPAQWVALASHDLQLGELLADCFDVAHLAVRTDGDALHFDYRLEPGPATTRTAITLLAQCGVNAAVLDHARQRAAALEGH